MDRRHGRRVGRVAERTTAGTTSRFVYADDRNDITAVLDAADQMVSAYGRTPGGELVAARDGGQPNRFTLTNTHHDVVGAFGAWDPSVAASAAYTPFVLRLT